MPWLGYHMHQFIAYGENYGTPSPDDDDFGLEVRDEKKVRLSKIAPESKCKFVYEYDFGDDWLHDIRVEKISRL